MVALEISSQVQPSSSPSSTLCVFKRSSQSTTCPLCFCSQTVVAALRARHALSLNVSPVSSASYMDYMRFETRAETLTR